MEDLRERILRLSDLDRVALIEALVRMDDQQRAIARGAGSRARLGSIERNRAEEAQSNCNRLGKILYFLRHRSPTFDTSTEDAALCDTLAERFRAKGQWTGEHST